MKYKVNLRKIFALIVSVALVISAFAVFSVSADDETVMTNQEYYAAQSYLIAKYKDGDISYSEFQERSQAVTDEFVTNNTIGGVLQSGALNASNTFTAVSKKIGDTFQKYGDAGREYIDDYVSEFFDSYTVLSDKPTTDLQGGNAVLEVVLGTGSDSQRRKYYLNDYGLKLVNSDGAISYKMRSNTLVRMSLSQNGKTSEYTYDSSNAEISYSLSNANVSAIRIYGDWRSDDDTPVETDDTFETVKDYDFSEVPEKELEDLLKKILDEFEINEPDLSTMEGLLKAIYARLGTLDSDNDNALLSQILSAIKAIKLDNSDNSDLLKVLEDLKNSLVYDDGENVETISEQLKKIIDNQLTVDDLTIDEELYNNRMEVLQLRLIGKFSFIHDLSDFVIYIFDSYSNSSENPEISFTYDDKSYSVNFDYYKDVLPLAQGIIAAFVYITYAYHTYKKIPSYINGGDNE